MSADIKKWIFVSWLCFSCISVTFAQDKKPQGAAPVTVVVSDLRVGVIAPEVEYLGTVYYPEVSDVAAESGGRIEAVNFEEGQRVKKGDVLAKISSELTEKTLQEAAASYDEVSTHLENARTDLRRIESLYQKKVVPEQRYNDGMFKVKSLEKRAASLLAEIDRLKIELQQKIIRAPFDGIIIKHTFDFCRFDNNISPNFNTTQCSG